MKNKITGNEVAESLTIRQQIAIAAMQGLAANSEIFKSIPDKSLEKVGDLYSLYAVQSVGMADALITELNKDNGKPMFDFEMRIEQQKAKNITDWEFKRQKAMLEHEWQQGYAQAVKDSLS